VLTALVLAAAVAAASPAQVRDLIEADRPAEALAAARDLAERSADPDTLTALGEALYRAGLIDEAGKTIAPLALQQDAPPRALVQLALVHAAQGKDDAIDLMERAVAAAPLDAWVVFRASGLTRSRARAVALLSSYLELAPGDDADRLEGARGTIRLNTALGERKVWTRTAAPPRIEIPLKPVLGGAGTGYYVEAGLDNRKKIRLLLDTGSTGLFVVERAVKKGGFTPLSEETVFAGGGTGRTRSSRGLLSKLAIGGLTIADALITTTKDEFDPQGRIHGVLGLNVFSGYRVTMDLAAQRLVLDPCGAEPPGAPYWEVSGQMLVRAGATQGADGLFLFDTGATRSMLARTFAASIPGAEFASPAAVRTYGGSVSGASFVRGVRLRFGDLTSDGGSVHASDLTQRSRLSGVEVSGFLGMDLLDGTTIVVDTCEQRVAVRAAPR